MGQVKELKLTSGNCRGIFCKRAVGLRNVVVGASQGTLNTTEKSMETGGGEMRGSFINSMRGHCSP